MKYKLYILILLFVSFNGYTQEKTPDFRISENGKYALFSIEGKQLTEPLYNYGICYQGICKVRRNKKIGFLNLNGTQIIPCKYSMAYVVAKGVIAVSNGKEWFCLNEENQKITPFIIDKVTDMCITDKRYAIEVKKGKSSGLYFYRGKSIKLLPLHKYYSINKQEQESGLIEVIIDSNREYINKKKVDTISHLYTFQSDYINGLIYAEKHLTKEEIKELSKTKLTFSYSKRGVLDSIGNIIIPFKYESIDILKNGFFKVRDIDNNGHIIYGYFNSKGKQTLPFKYTSASNFSPKGYALIDTSHHNGNLFFIDTLGKVISTPKFDMVSSYLSDDGLAIARKKKKYGFINAHSTVIIDFKFDNVSHFHKGLARVSKNKKFGFINVKGEIIIPIKFDKANYYFTKEVEELELDRKKYYFDRTGKEIKTIANNGYN